MTGLIRGLEANESLWITGRIKHHFPQAFDATESTTHTCNENGLLMEAVCQLVSKRSLDFTRKMFDKSDSCRNLPGCLHVHLLFGIPA